MLATVRYREPRRVRRPDTGPSSLRRESLDMARRSRYTALLRRWAQERLPAGTQAAVDAGEWIRETLTRAAGPTAESAQKTGSFLVRLRAHLLADRGNAIHARIAERAAPPPRVEQLIGCNRLGDWEAALALLTRTQRELVILRVEFGLDFSAIAAEMELSEPVARAETVNALAALIDALGEWRRGRAA
jgi:DNA-directed RNA polymerase specialized sigma24 family protein